MLRNTLPHRFGFLALLVATLAFLTPIASARAADVDAVTMARYNLKLGFTVGGQILKVHVQPGEAVKAGQILMELEDEEGKAAVQVYEMRAKSDVQIQAAEAELNLARVEEKAMKQVYENRAGSVIEYERAQAKTKIAEAKLSLAKQEKEEAAILLRREQAKHDQKVLKAPTDGVVDESPYSEGETVESLKPVLRLVVANPLWVDASVPTAETLQLKVGDKAWVKSKLAGHTQAVEGKIIHMVQVADAASDTRMVRVEIQNPKGLPAGGHVTVTFQQPTGVASAGNSGR